MYDTINLPGNITTSKRELKDLGIALLAIAFAFTVATGGLSFGFLLGFVVAVLTVGIAFIFHELAHKITAQKYGCEAEFKKSTPALIASVIISFFGIILLAPGAVVISTFSASESERGKISWAGPLSNLVLGVIFIVLAFIVQIGLIKSFFIFAAFINCLIGLFNMIPVLMLDGKKILSWDKKVYTITVVLFVILYFVIKIPTMI